MKVLIVAAVAMSACLPRAALAQSAAAGGDMTPEHATYAVTDPAVDVRPGGTPSDGTATVSPFTAVQAMDRLDPLRSSVSVSVATSYITGDFGASTNTSIVSSAAGIRYALSDLRLSASLPWMRIRSNGTIFTGIDGTPIIAAPDAGRRTTHSGLGDLTLGGAYTVTPSQNGPEIEVSGRVKLNTAADSTGLSTGKTDYSAGLQVMQPMGRFVPFASVSYRIFGDPVGLDLKDGVALSAGTSIVAGPDNLVVLSYHFAQAASRLVGDSHELFAGASTNLEGVGLRVTGFATAGLSRGAAGLSIGLGLSKSF